MTGIDPLIGPSLLRSRALSRWESEGGAIQSAPQEELGELPIMSNAEIVDLRVRLIALENLLITVVAEGSKRQLTAAREAAEYITPREGVGEHPLTVRAADQIRKLVDRAEHYRSIRA